VNSIIIGGTSGIGLETARFLRKKGYDVIVGSRNQRKDEMGFNFEPIDVSNESSIEQFFRSIAFKHIDSLVYSAGITTNQKRIQDFDAEEYRKVHNVNLLGVILTLKYAFPLLKKAKGKVVIVSSFASRTYSQFSGFEYTVSKAGLSGLVKQLAIEWAKDGVLINNVFPSMVETPMLLRNVEASELRAIENSIPLGRIAQPIEIATAIEFLLGESNSYITGAGLDINGGQFLSG
jgi:NAD(P)-dependent dehydrogenase (short-subunit alcohol dehydrogenase family)